jgi:nicotinamide-nucleotide amidase
MAMTGVVHVISVGPGPLAPADVDATAVIGALARAGVPATARIAVEEDEMALESALAEPDGLTVILAGTGGSGGDVVRRVVARATGARLTLSERMLGALEDAYRRVDRPLPRRVERLALLPSGASVWIAAGSEPAWALDSARGGFAVLPRAPLAGGTDQSLLEQLVAFARARLATRTPVAMSTLRCAGVGVGDIEERLADWLGKEAEVTVVVTPADGDVWVRLRARGNTPTEAAERLAPTESAVRAALGDDCYGRDTETLEQVVGESLERRGLSLAVAESCTGGLVGHRLTGVPGSSRWFERGVVVYSNTAKMDLLGVPEAVLRTHGAVSAETAQAMARGMCETARTPCAVSITGIAGPDGATPGKPVGTVFIGLAVLGEVTARRFRFLGDRFSVKWQSSQMALDMLRRKLGGV